MKLQMPPFDQARVLVLGDIMLDRYWEGGTSRISPEAPVPVVKVDQISGPPRWRRQRGPEYRRPGRRSVSSGLYTGDDEMADSLQDMLGGAGVSCHFSRVPDHPTITKLRVISRQQQLIRLDFEESDLAAAGGDLLQASHGDSLVGLRRTGPVGLRQGRAQ